MRVLAVGGTGQLGRQAVRHLAASDVVTEVVIAGRNLEAGRRFATELGEKADAVQVDATDGDRLASVAADCDLLLNTAGPEWVTLLPTLRAAIDAGVHYCDIGGMGPLTEEQLALDGAARDADVAAVVGAGSDPGVTNLLALHAARQLDTVEAVGLYSFLPWADPAKILEDIRSSGRVAADWQTVLRLVAGPVTVYRDGQWRAVEPADHALEVPLPEGANVRAFPVNTPEPVTLPRALPNVQHVVAAWSFSPPPLNALYVRLGQRLARGELDPAQAATVFFETAVSEPARWLTAPEGLPSTSVYWATATGAVGGRRARYTCWPVGFPPDVYVSAAVAALKLLRGAVHERGVLPPEACLEPVAFFREASRYGPQEDRGKPLLGESFEWLD